VIVLQYSDYLKFYLNEMARNSCHQHKIIEKLIVYIFFLTHHVVLKKMLKGFHINSTQKILKLKL